MKEDLSDYRKAYQKDHLSRTELESNPLQQFKKWFEEVEASKTVEEVNAMTISTIGEDGFPKGRVVLLKKYDDSGFYFYTNYNSEKGKSIAYNNKVSLIFFWPGMERQVIIKGLAERTSKADSEEYFNSRPRGSRLGAIASNQSDVIECREILEENLKNLEKQFENKEIHRPENWGGYVVKPVSIEFWQGRTNRLHDRFRYTFTGKDWKIERLAP